jgi:predicted phosphodiesterase
MQNGTSVRIGVLSDAHGNIEAFELALRLLERHHADEIYFLGDSVGYLPGSSVAASVIEHRLPAVMGNHEAMLLDLDLDVDQPDDVYRLRTTAAAMPGSVRTAIAEWPSTRTIELACGPARLIHGSPTDSVFGYVYPDTDLSRFAALPELADATVFMGNTHRPFVRSSGTTMFVNVGSCGLPRDVGRLGSCCVFDDATNEVRILRFDISLANEAARRRCGSVDKLVTDVMVRDEGDYVGELVAV